MADKSELASALKDVLEKRGILPEVKARLRAEVYNALDDQTMTKPKLCQENFLLNELIREYCEFNQYNYTRSVLLVETGQPKEALDRQFLANELSMTDRDSSVPLLYQILDCFLKRVPNTAAARTHPSSSPTPDPEANQQPKAGRGTVLSIEKPTCINTT